MPGLETRRELPTVDRLRHEIDRGHTGEKVDFPDPAAAPLGTDTEAAGTTPGPDEVAMELAHNKAVPKRAKIPGIVIYSAVAGLVAASLLAIIAGAAS